MGIGLHQVSVLAISSQLVAFSSVKVPATSRYGFFCFFFSRFPLFLFILLYRSLTNLNVSWFTRQHREHSVLLWPVLLHYWQTISNPTNPVRKMEGNELLQLTNQFDSATCSHPFSVRYSLIFVIIWILILDFGFKLLSLLYFALSTFLFFPSFSIAKWSDYSWRK